MFMCMYVMGQGEGKNQIIYMTLIPWLSSTATFEIIEALLFARFG